MGVYQEYSMMQPEYKRAFTHALENLPQHDILSAISSDYSIFDNDAFHVYREPIVINKIPSSGIWRWNQTKSRVPIQTDGHTGFISKLIPRNRDGTKHAPSYKLWKCGISSKSSDESVVCLWAEKGSHPPEVSINDYAFLKPFMSEEVISLFWP